MLFFKSKLFKKIFLSSNILVLSFTTIFMSGCTKKSNLQEKKKIKKINFSVDCIEQNGQTNNKLILHNKIEDKDKKNEVTKTLSPQIFENKNIEDCKIYVLNQDDFKKNSSFFVNFSLPTKDKQEKINLENIDLKIERLFVENGNVRHN